MQSESSTVPQVDEVRLQRIKKQAIRSGTWEGMCFWLQKIVREGGESPFFPLVAVWADVESGMILHHELDRPEKGTGLLQTALLQAMEDAQIVPDQVVVGTSDAVQVLKPVTRPLNIIVSEREELPVVQAAVHWLQSSVAQNEGEKESHEADSTENDLFIQVENANYELLALFESWLAEQGLSQSTRVRHLQTMDLFLNSYLMDIGPMSPDEGIFQLDDFFCQWLPKATPWISSSAVQGMVPGLKKFALCLHQQGLLPQDDLQDFLALIKANRKNWEQAGYMK
ncbi:MAG: DUF6930 domain-containing protein [Desulfovermiculus sp.]